MNALEWTKKLGIVLPDTKYQESMSRFAWAVSAHCSAWRSAMENEPNIGDPKEAAKALQEFSDHAKELQQAIGA